MPEGISSNTPGTRIMVNGTALHCIEAGPKDGPLVLLLHGFPEFWWGWRHQIEPLAQAGCRVVVPDQRGYNLSDKPAGRRAYELDVLAGDVAGLADALGHDTFHVVGHDWGGLAAWWTATRYPQRVASLVILNAPHPEVAGAYMRSHPSQMLKSSYIGFFQLPRLPEAMLSARDYRSMRDALRRSSRPGTFSDADLEHYRAAWRQPGALTAMLNWYRALPFRPRLSVKPKLSMPVLVLWGMRDQFLEFGLAEASLELCESGRIQRFENATHWLHLEEAEAVNAALVSFLVGSGPGLR